MALAEKKGNLRPMLEDVKSKVRDRSPRRTPRPRWTGAVGERTCWKLARGEISFFY
jgi:hypothetical protein